MTVSRHRDPAGQRRRRDNAWNRLDDRMRPCTSELLRTALTGIAAGMVAGLVSLATSVAPDATARATVPLPTAARSVQVEVSYDPVPSMSIGAEGAWDPDAAQSPVAVSQPPVQPRSTPTTVRRPTVTSGPGTTAPVPTTPATTTPATTTPATEAAATPTASPPATATDTTAPSTEPSPTGLPVVDPIETEETTP